MTSIRKSIAWLSLSQLASLILQFVYSIVLARFLLPREMGVFAVAAAVSGALSIFQNFGLQSMVVREEVMTDDLKHTIFSINCLTNLALSAAIVAASFILSRSFHEEGIRNVLLVLAICPVLNISSFLPAAMLEREGRFATIAAVTACSNILMTVTTIVFVVCGLNYMSMAYGFVVSAATSSILYPLWAREHRSIRWQFTSWRRVASFGFQMLLTTSTMSISQRLSDILVGRIAGLGSLGLYTRALALSNMVWANVHGLMSRAVLVDLATLQRSEVPLSERYRQTATVTTALLWPAFAGMAVIARPFVLTIYGPKWERAADLLSLFCVASMILVTITMAWEVLTVSGNLRLQTRLEFIRMVVSIALLAGGALISLEAAVASRIPEAIVAFFLYRPHLDRITGTRFRDLLPGYARGFVLTIGAVLPAAVLRLAAAPTLQSPLLVGAAVAAGVALWTGLVFWTDHPLRVEISKMFQWARSRLPARA